MGISFIKKIAPLLLLCFLTGCKTDWKENFKEKKKTPFGTYIVFHEAKDLFDGNKIIELKKNIHDFLIAEDKDTLQSKNYVLIKGYPNRLTNKGSDKLLDFVAKGNTALLSLNYFKDTLKTRLGFSTKNLSTTAHTTQALKKLKGTLSFTNKKFSKTSFYFDRNLRKNYFSAFDSIKTTVLGTIKVNDSIFPNFIKIQHGKGALLLHSNPVVFTNYYLLSKKEAYTANVFSYLPNQPILWDPHLKRSSNSKKNKDNRSLFKFFLANTSLKWFLYITLAGLLLFMLFNAKRKQRPIPKITPLKNTTVAFAQTIANLYLKEEDHKNLVDKRISFFLEKVRANYLLDTSNLNSLFIEKLAAKSGNNLQRTKYLINTIIALSNKTECSEEELVVLYKMTENFLNKKYGDTK